MATSIFPSGARVLLDGRDEAIVRQAFPKGSTSFAFPHYKIDVVGGGKNVAISMTRVGVVRKKDPERDPRTPSLVKRGSRIRSEGYTLVVQEVLHNDWIVGRNPQGHFVIANRNPHTKKWDSLEWEKTVSEASVRMHKRARKPETSGPLIYGRSAGASAPARDPAKGKYAWEIWSLGDSYDGVPGFVAAYSDKGQAETRMARMKRSHPYERYTLKHRPVPARHLFDGTRRVRKAREAWQRKIGW